MSLFDIVFNALSCELARSTQMYHRSYLTLNIICQNATAFPAAILALIYFETVVFIRLFPATVFCMHIFFQMLLV